MGVVYKAEDTAPRPPGGAQVPARRAGPGRPGPRALPARGAGRLRRSTIPTSARSTTSDEDQGRPFIAMELLEGQTLKQPHRRPARSRSTRSLELGIQIADALEAAHRKGIVAPRHQARQHLRHRARAGQDPRLRPRQAPREPARSASRRSAPRCRTDEFADERGLDAGDRGLHVARAGAGRGGGRPHRPLLLRGGALRDGHRPPGLRRRHHRHRLRGDPQPDARPRSRTSTATCRTGSSRSSASCSRRTAGCATSPRPSCAPTCSG